MLDQARQRALSAAAFMTGMASWLIPVSVSAAGSGDGETFQHADTGDLLANLVWVIVAMAIVITLIILVIRWLSARSRTWGSPNRSLRSLGGLTLGQHSSMQVVELAGRVYIVGVGEQVTLLDKIEDPEQAAAVIEALEKQASQVWSPKELTGLFRRRPNAAGRSEDRETAGAAHEAGDFQQLLISKLNRQTDRKEQLEALLKNHNTNERLMDHEK